VIVEAEVDVGVGARGAVRIRAAEDDGDDTGHGHKRADNVADDRAFVVGQSIQGTHLSSECLLCEDFVDIS